MSRSSTIRSIKTHRLLIEQHLTMLLLGAESSVTFAKVKALIFEADTTDLNTYVAAMCAELRCYDIYDTDGTLLEIIQDAWNYFPHRFLDGRCPVEIMIEKTR
jgi:hypothetical protein